jgi:hypothetical protein
LRAATAASVRQAAPQANQLKIQMMAGDLAEANDQIREPSERFVPNVAAKSLGGSSTYSSWCCEGEGVNSGWIG